MLFVKCSLLFNFSTPGKNIVQFNTQEKGKPASNFAKKKQQNMQTKFVFAYIIVKFQ